MRIRSAECAVIRIRPGLRRSASNLRIFVRNNGIVRPQRALSTQNTKTFWHQSPRTNSRHAYSFETDKTPQRRQNFRKMVLTTNFAGATSQRIRNRIVSAYLGVGFYRGTLSGPYPYFLLPPFVAIWFGIGVRHCEACEVSRRRDQSCGGDRVCRRVGFQAARDGVERLVSLFASQRVTAA